MVPANVSQTGPAFVVECYGNSTGSTELFLVKVVVPLT